MRRTARLISTTTKSTETIDGCTTTTTVTEKSRDLVGTLTADGVTQGSFAFVQDFSVKATTNCQLGSAPVDPEPRSGSANAGPPSEGGGHIR